ncbi:hypothetical protein QMO56_23135 [Roseomonas sp. E05]|uniref:hypothetical protein n=1 Tax=Roseomonas sp. E05 TaxID=3046310 RepID=UPI0024BBB88C|nr:hypothetical protein [Roseomonas sp. E05]MDJ0391017.1 hypothetical protein [Roseomonas sp. E05]
MFSQRLGTALGDFLADTSLGYGGGALVFGAGLAVVAAAYFQTDVSRTLLFWAAFILARPLGSFLGKPVADGGMALSRATTSAVLGAFMLACILLLSRLVESGGVEAEQTP